MTINTILPVHLYENYEANLISVFLSLAQGYFHVYRTNFVTYVQSSQRTEILLYAQTKIGVPYLAQNLSNRVGRFQTLDAVFPKDLFSDYLY